MKERGDVMWVHMGLDITISRMYFDSCLMVCMHVIVMYG